MSTEELVAVIQAGAEERMGELWEQVKGLVAWKARHIMTALDLRGSPCGVELEDLMQSGYIAMVEAVHYYTPESGAAFSTCLINRLKTVFAEATGYRTKRGQNEPLNNSFSLDKTVDDESDGTPFGEFVPDPKAAAAMLSIEEKLWREQLHEALEKALATLPKEGSDILRMRHYYGMSLRDVGELEGASAEYIRKIEGAAIRHLRKPSVVCNLLPFYDFDFYGGTGLGTFQHTGMSVQERYLVIEEERKERTEQRRKERATKQQEGKSHEYAKMVERTVQGAQAKVARMTPEEKAKLLAKYGYV